MVGMPQIQIDTDMSASACFGCGQNNPIGLKLTFRKEGEAVRAEFTPQQQFQGWPGIVHGGVIACILDEAMTYAARFAGRSCVTARMAVKFLKPAPLEQPLIITSFVTRNTRRLIEAIARITLKDGTVIAESSAVQYVVESETGTKQEPAHG